MSDRIPVYVTASDPILENGVTSQLRDRAEVTLVRTVTDHANTVCIVVGDEVDAAALHLVRQLRGQGSRQILIVLVEVDDSTLLAAIEAGVCGVIPRRDASPERLVTAVRHAALGGVLSPKLVGRLLEQVNRLQSQVLAPKGLRLTGLSDREVEVLRMMSQGMAVREIAEKLCYSERTIKNTLHEVVSRFHLRNRTHAVAFALREGMI